MKNKLTYIFTIILCISIFSRLSFAITADEVFDNHIKAAGGKDNFMKIKKMMIKGKASGDVESTFITYVIDNYSKSETDYGCFKSYSGSDSKGMWESTSYGTIRYLKNFEIKDNMTDSILYSFTNYNELEKRYVDKKQEGETAYHVVEVKTNNSYPVLLYFNENSWLIDKAETDNIKGIGGFKGSTVVEYKEYRNIDGVLIPCRFKSSSPMLSFELLYENIQINPNIDNSMLNHPKYEPNFIFADGIKSIEIPFKRNRTNAVIVEVQINNSDKKYKFLVDTGASMTVIKESLAKELELELYGGHKSAGIGNESKSSKFAVIKSMKFGDNLELLNCNASTISDSLAIDGIIGYDIISQTAMEFDYRHSKIIFYDIKSFAPSNDFENISFYLMWNIPFSELTINEKDNAVFLLDTGYMGSQSGIFSGFADKAGIEPSDSGNFMAGGVGGQIPVKKAVLNYIRIGNFLIPSIESLVFDKPNMKFDGLLGTGFFSAFSSVIFDYKNSLLLIKTRPWLGIKFINNRSEQTIIVNSVIDNSPAAKAGILINDIIIKINDTDMNSSNKVIEILENSKAGDKIKILLERNNEQLEKEVILEQIYYSKK